MKVTNALVLGTVAVLLSTPPAFAQGKDAKPGPAESQWQKLPRMTLEGQFAGPLRDTVIQRWRDPGDGSVCYLYLPIAAPHTPPAASGFVQYGANTIGSISCFANPGGKTAAEQPPAAAAAPPAAAKPPPPRPTPRPRN